MNVNSINLSSFLGYPKLKEASQKQPITCLRFCIVNLAGPFSSEENGIFLSENLHFTQFIKSLLWSVSFSIIQEQNEPYCLIMFLTSII